MITSAENQRWRCDVVIADLDRAGLPVPSVVRTAKIACIEPGRVLKKAGTLDVSAVSKVHKRLRAYLA
jgi:mRNA interferase MazF